MLHNAVFALHASFLYKVIFLILALQKFIHFVHVLQSILFVCSITLNCMYFSIVFFLLFFQTFYNFEGTPLLRLFVQVVNVKLACIGHFLLLM